MRHQDNYDADHRQQLSYIFQANRYRPVVARNCLAVAASISPFKGFVLD